MRTATATQIFQKGRKVKVDQMKKLTKPPKNTIRECLSRGNARKAKKSVCGWVACFHINFSYSFSYERVYRVFVSSKPVLAKAHEKLFQINQIRGYSRYSELVRVSECTHFDGGQVNEDSAGRVVRSGAHSCVEVVR